MKSLSRKQILFFVSLLVLFLLACSALVSRSDPYLAPVSATAPAPIVTNTAAPGLSQQVTLVAVPFNESMENGLEKVADQVVEHCPTAALSFKQ